MNRRKEDGYLFLTVFFNDNHNWEDGGAEQAVIDGPTEDSVFARKK